MLLFQYLYFYHLVVQEMEWFWLVACDLLLVCQLLPLFLLIDTGYYVPCHENIRLQCIQQLTLEIPKGRKITRPPQMNPILQQMGNAIEVNITNKIYNDDIKIIDIWIIKIGIL